MRHGKKEKLSGLVIRRKVHVGSKSEHDAILIVLDQEKEGGYKLRVKGGNPFHDPALDKFVGQHVFFDGEIVDGVRGAGATVFVDSVADIKVFPAKPARRPKGPGL